MTLHQLKVFVAVAKLGSFTQAGEKLHISQPSLSGIVSGLARELGAKLFERLGNKMHLTAVGERVLLRAEEALSKVDGIREEIAELTGLKKGRIRVGGSGLAGASFLPIAVQAFKKDHPGVEVILGIQRSDSLEKGLLEGALDLAVTGKAPSSPLLAAEIYGEEEVVVIAPPNHTLTRRRSVPLELIAREALIAQKAAIIREMVEHRFAERRLPFTPTLEVDVQTGSRDAIRSAVARGLGIGFISKCHVVADVQAGRLKLLNVPELKLTRTMYIAVHKRRESSPLIQLFIVFLKKHGFNRNSVTGLKEAGIALRQFSQAVDDR